ncbi:MAG: CHASE4 domain-containing protein [Armatimonadota bacterium]
MSIRTRTLIIIGITFLCLLTVMLVCANLILLRSFARFEEREVREDVERAVAAFDNETDMLNTTLGDWAPWDETYQFMATQTPTYVSNNLDIPTLCNLGLGLLVCVNTRDQIIFVKCIDLQRKVEVKAPATLAAALKSHPRLLHRVPSNGVTGILVLPEGPLLIASQPVLRNDHSGPSNGILLMGRFINQAEIDHLSRIVHFPLRLQTVGDPRLPATFRLAQSNLSHQSPIFIHAPTTRTINGYALLNDTNQRPALLLEITAAREIYQQGVKARWYILASLLFVGLVFGVVIMLQLERVVLSRITWLSGAVRDIGQSGDLTTRIPVNSIARQADELDSLASTVNEMLVALAASHQALLTQEALRESEARYRSLIELSPLAVFLLSDTRCVFVNAAGMALLGASQSSDILGHDVQEVLHTNDQDWALQRIRQVAATGAIDRTELQLLRLDGVAIEVEAVVGPFNFQDSTTVQITAIDISERKHTEQAIRRYQERLRALASDVALAEETERRRIAGDLHDHIGQSLVACRLMLGTLKDTLPSSEVQAQLEEVRALLEQAVQWTRSLTMDLSPPILHEFGLVAAIHWLAEQCQERHGLLVCVNDNGALPPRQTEANVMLFRVVRELLLNVVKHAQTSQATVTITTSVLEYRIVVEDDGIGVAPGAERQNGFGLFSIRERLHYLGGQVTIESEVSHGTRVVITMPISESEVKSDAAHSTGR